MQELMPKDWRVFLSDQWNQSYYASLWELLQEKYRNTIVHPKREDVFQAFDLCKLDQTKAIILGQDPYHGPNQAHGLAFSVNTSCSFPPSLRNIFKELIADVGITPMNGDLSHWASQGILLLNATLTVEDGKAGSHQQLGWETFTDQVISKLSKEKEQLIFVLWGAFAIKKAKLIDASKHSILTSAHPSPLSAYRGFFGSKPFSQINSILKKHGKNPIEW